MTDNIKLPSPKFLYDEEMGELHDPGDYAPSDCAALYTADQVREAVRLNATVPDGWKLVPVEPTLEMLEAGTYKIGVRDCYRAMLSAAPAAPQPAQPLDLGVMELAESVGLIGPASRADDLHEAIQRFHDLIVANASIKAALHFADGLAKPAQSLTDEKEALGLLNAENNRLMKLVIELRGEIVRMNAQAVQAEPQPRDDGIPASSDERHLRRLLAARVAMPSTYFDDGEAHGAEHGIQIDFMREPVAHIDAKLSALNVARLAVAAPQPAQPLTDEKDALLRRALEALEGFVHITNDSQGVAGYHLNGDTAEWDEFDEVDAASSAIEAIRTYLGVKND